MMNIRYKRIEERVLFTICTAVWFLIFLLFSHINVASADTTIFTETCNSNPSKPLANSTSITVGTSWSATTTLDGSPSVGLRSGTTVCSPPANEANDGIAHKANPSPSTDIYYAQFDWIDGGGAASTEGQGMMVNFNDGNNYYACKVNDNDSGAVDFYISKESGGSGTTIGSLTNQAVTINGDTLRCQIDYSGASPVITFSNVTESVEYLDITDSSSPLTKTAGAGVMIGSTADRTNDDYTSTLDFDNFTVVEVTAVATAPTVTTGSATAITSEDAALNGSIDATGGASITEHGFAYGTVNTLSSVIATTTMGSAGVELFTKKVFQLTPGTTYYFRAYATNSAGTGYGSISNFTASAASNPTRTMRLFEGFRINFFNGKITLYQR